MCHTSRKPSSQSPTAYTGETLEGFSTIQPVCIEGSTIYVADTAVGRIFGIHLSGVLPDIYTISEAVAAFRGVSSLLSTSEREAAKSLGRTTSVQDPQGTPSSKSIKSVKIMLESLEMLIKTLSYVNADSITQLRLAV